MNARGVNGSTHKERAPAINKERTAIKGGVVRLGKARIVPNEGPRSAPKTRHKECDEKLLPHRTFDRQLTTNQFVAKLHSRFIERNFAEPALSMAVPVQGAFERRRC